MDTHDTDAVVIGAGALGLACAAALARRGFETIVLERMTMIGAGVSSRNSEVIHAGLYYATGSLKHQLCVDGRRRLYQYLAARRIAHRKCGKLIVATSDAERPGLEALLARGLANGVEGLTLLDGATARGLEPALACVAAILSSETGVFDSHGFMLALRGDLEDHGGAVALASPFARAWPEADGRWTVETGGVAPARLRCRALLNAAGLHAHAVAAAIEGAPPPPAALRLAKGSYFACAGGPAFSRLIYPIPVDGGLGVHLTLDLAGRMRFGPDVEWLPHDDPERVDYAVAPDRAAGFYAAIRQFWPQLPDHTLTPDYAGCRPKLSGPGAPAADFAMLSAAEHGQSGLVQLLGIESPGLTASLAIAEQVATAFTASARNRRR